MFIINLSIELVLLTHELFIDLFLLLFNQFELFNHHDLCLPQPLDLLLCLLLYYN